MKNNKKEQKRKYSEFKNVKLQSQIHHALKIYAAEKGFLLNEAVRDLIEKATGKQIK